MADYRVRSSSFGRSPMEGSEAVPSADGRLQSQKQFFRPKADGTTERFAGRSRAGGVLPCADPRMLRFARRLVPARNGLGARHFPALLWGGRWRTFSRDRQTGTRPSRSKRIAFGEIGKPTGSHPGGSDRSPESRKAVTRGLSLPARWAEMLASRGSTRCEGSTEGKRIGGG